MKIDAVIDDEIIPVQVVKRGNTVYIRRCAVTMFQPTEKQKEVRRRIALTSINKFDEAQAKRENLTREEINTAIQKAFSSWNKSPKKRSAIEETLTEHYGSDVKEVKKSYNNLKIYNYP